MNLGRMFLTTSSATPSCFLGLTIICAPLSTICLMMKSSCAQSMKLYSSLISLRCLAMEQRFSIFSMSLSSRERISNLSRVYRFSILLILFPPRVNNLRFLSCYNPSILSMLFISNPRISKLVRWSNRFIFVIILAPSDNSTKQLKYYNP